MKLILTHKKQLQSAGDVARFIRYCYGVDAKRPVVPVEGYLPGLPTGAPALDAEALLTFHHGGKASKARSIAFSSEYFPTRETALLHAPAMPKVASAFRTVWAPDSNALSIVHLTEGRKQWSGMWRLDCHLIPGNSDGTKGLQWTREQCSAMQDLNWLPHALKEQFSISPGKGAGVARRTQQIPYPHAKELISYEIGKLTDIQIETCLSSGLYGAARRAKDGRIISLESGGRRVNIARARELNRVRDGVGNGTHLLSCGGAGQSDDVPGLANSGHCQEATVPLVEKGVDHNMGHGSQRMRACADHLRDRRRRLSAQRATGLEREIGFTCLGHSIRGGPGTALAGHGSAGALVKSASAYITQAARILETIETIEIFT